MTDRPGAVPLDDTDRRILGVLAAEGRISVNELAARVHVARATAYARLDRLQRDGVITGFHAAVDREKLGLSTAALILVNVRQRDWRSARDELAALPGVDYVALTSGTFDFAVHVRVPDPAALRDVVLVRLQAMPAVRSTQTIFILDELRPPIDPSAFLPE